jgi:hypothetical protein
MYTISSIRLGITGNLRFGVARTGEYLHERPDGSWRLCQRSDGTVPPGDVILAAGEVEIAEEGENTSQFRGHRASNALGEHLGNLRGGD